LLIPGLWRFTWIVFFNKIHNYLQSELHLASLKVRGKTLYALAWEAGKSTP